MRPVSNFLIMQLSNSRDFLPGGGWIAGAYILEEDG